MSSNGAQEITKKTSGDSGLSPLKAARQKTVRASLLCIWIAFQLTKANYNVIIYLENSPCLDEKAIHVSKTTAYPCTCTMKGALWTIVSSLLFFSASAVLINALFGLKWMQTSPRMLTLWISFTWLWVLDNVITTLVILLTFKDHTMLTMVAMPCVILSILGTWTTKTASDLYEQVEKLHDAMKMKEINKEQ